MFNFMAILFIASILMYTFNVFLGVLVRRSKFWRISGAILSVLNLVLPIAMSVMNIAASSLILFSAMDVVYIYLLASKYKSALGLMKSKERWIRKATSQLEKMDSYCQLDTERVPELIECFESILYLCNSYKLPYYIVSNLFDASLPAYLNVCREYKRFCKKHKKVDSAMKKNDEIFGECTERFLNLVMDKKTEIQEMVENGEVQLFEDITFEYEVKCFNAMTSIDSEPETQATEMPKMTEKEITEKLEMMEDADPTDLQQATTQGAC